MRKPVILVTGAGGEIGHGLLTGLAGSGRPIVTLDVAPLDRDWRPSSPASSSGQSPTRAFWRACGRVRGRSRVPPAALLVTRAEFTPTAAHHVNVEGTLNLLEFAQLKASRTAVKSFSSTHRR
jgi:nucleoside-diphosphate-sugar epimerase